MRRGFEDRRSVILTLIKQDFSNFTDKRAVLDERGFEEDALGISFTASNQTQRLCKSFSIKRL